MKPPQAEPIPRRLSGKQRDFASRLFGHDIFVSFALGPPPRGTQSYASDLARRLREQDLKVFYSEDELPAGSYLSQDLLAALTASRALVVVANRETLREPRWVRTEVEQFRARHPGRPVIPVNVDRALQDEQVAVDVRAWLPFDEIVWADESADAVTNGIASEAVVQRIAAAPRRLRVNSAWRWVVRGAFATVVAAAVALGWTAKLAIDNADRAQQELQRATSLRLAAEAESMIAGNRPEGDERALLQLTAAAALAPVPAVEAALWRQLTVRAQLVRLIPAAGPVLAFAVAPDGRRAAYAATDGRIHMLDLHSGQALLPPWDAASGTVHALAFSTDGKLLASAGHDATVRLWSNSDGRAVGPPLRGHKAAVEQLTFSPDGLLLASGSADTQVWIWNIEQHRAQGPPLKKHAGRIEGMAFSPDSRRLATVSMDRSLRLWEIKKRAQLAVAVHGHRPTHWISSVAFSPDGKQIVTGSSDHTLRRWDARTLHTNGAPMSGHSGTVYALSYSPDGTTILSAGADNSLRRWDASTGLPRGPLLEGHRGWVLHAGFANSGQGAFSAGLDGTIRVWSFEGSSALSRPVGRPEFTVRSLALSLDGRLLAASHGKDRVSVWRTFGDSAPVAELSSDGLSDALIALSPTGDLLFAASTDGMVQSWRVDGATAVGLPQRFTQSAPRAIALAGDGSRLAALDNDGTLAVASVSDGRLAHLTMLDRQPDGISVKFGSDASRVIVRNRRGPPRAFDVPASREVPQFVGFDSKSIIALSPDFRLGIALSAGTDTATLVDARSGRAVGPPLFVNRTPVIGPPSPTDSVGLNFEVAFDRRSGHFATGAGDHAIRLWSATSGESAGPPLQGHEHAVSGLVFSGDGSVLASIDRGGHVRIWRGPRAWPSQLCSKLTRNMSPTEWRTWISPETPYRCACPGLPVPDLDNTKRIDVQACH